nr:protein nuclear fusion defective 4 [Quercus suber]
MPKLVLKAGSRPPWVGLAAAVWVEIAAGNSYNFPLYSSEIKSVLGYNQQQITILGVANDIGESVGILPGIACNKFPPWFLLLVGTVLCFFGYGVLWLSVSQTVENLPYWLLWIALCIATNSNAWFGTAVLVTNMRNFPLSRGTVAGILKGYIGLSAAVYTVIYDTVLNSSSSKLLLFLAIGLPVLCLALMYFIRACTPASGEDSSEHVHFLFTQVNSSDNLVQGEGGSTQTNPLLTPSSSATYLGSFHENEEASDVETLLAVGEGAIKKKSRPPRRGEDFKLREALVKADFWLLWFSYFLAVGTGVTVLNNLAQIGIALGVDDTTLLLSLFSFCNFVGRLGSGVISEHFVRLRTLPRTFWMICAHIFMIVSYLLYALGLSGTLYVATALLGICYGVQYSIMVPTASEIFGLRHFGIIYNSMALGNPIGAVLFSALLAGYIYDTEAAKQGSSTCLGPNCFRLTFLILAGLSGLGTIVSIILTIRVRPVYQMLYAGGSFRHPQSSNP